MHNCAAASLNGSTAMAAGYAGRADLAGAFVHFIGEKRDVPDATEPDTTAPIDPATRQSKRVKLVERLP